jgi:hypothetical protein
MNLTVSKQVEVGIGRFIFTAERMSAVHFLPPILITRWSLSCTYVRFAQLWRPTSWFLIYVQNVSVWVCVFFSKWSFLSSVLTGLDTNYWLTFKSFAFWKHSYSILFKNLLVFIIWAVFVLFHILFKLFPCSHSTTFPYISFSNWCCYLLRLYIVSVREIIINHWQNDTGGKRT